VIKIDGNDRVFYSKKRTQLVCLLWFCCVYYSYCWIRNTYYLPAHEDIPSEEEAANLPRLPYYQWVPMILLVQALLFYLPYGIWMSLSSRSGVDISSIVEAGQSFTVTDMTEIRDKTLLYMTQMMDRLVSVLV